MDERTVITRACEHMTHRFEVGDVVDNHDQAHLLVALGFAENVSDAAPAATEPAAADEAPESTTRRPRAGTTKE